jgi:hypothetical protein
MRTLHGWPGGHGDETGFSSGALQEAGPRSALASRVQMAFFMQIDGTLQERLLRRQRQVIYPEKAISVCSC